MCAHFDGCVTRSDEGLSRDPDLLGGVASNLSGWLLGEARIEHGFEVHLLYDSTKAPLGMSAPLPTKSIHTFGLCQHFWRAHVLDVTNHRRFHSPRSGLHGALVVGNIVCPH